LRKLVLHIGLHKTGSTTAQMTLHSQRNTLQKFDIEYPKAAFNYSTLMNTMFGQEIEKRPEHASKDLDTQEKVEAFQKTRRYNFRKNCAATEQKTTLISGEGMSLFSLKSVEKMADYFSKIYDDIEVLAYVRPPFSLLNSLFQQKVRRGQTIEDLIPAPPITRYQASIEPYLQTFGAEKVTIKPFAYGRLHQSCIVADVLQHCGAPDELYRQLTVRNVNQSLTWPAVVCLNSINRQLPNMKDGKPNPDRQTSLVQYARLTGGEKFALPKEILAKGFANSTTDIRWVEDQLGLSLSDLDQDFADNHLGSIEEFLQEKHDGALPHIARAFHDIASKHEKLAAVQPPQTKP
jgi:hypothetical protein